MQFWIGSYEVLISAGKIFRWVDCFRLFTECCAATLLNAFVRNVIAIPKARVQSPSQGNNRFFLPVVSDPVLWLVSALGISSWLRGDEHLRGLLSRS